MGKDMENNLILKKLISHILQLQETEEKFIDLANEIRYGPGKNGKSNDKKMSQTKYKLEQGETDKQKVSKVREFLQKNSKPDPLDTLAASDTMFTIHRA